jgi:hypothetical protein
VTRDGHFLAGIVHLSHDGQRARLEVAGLEDGAILLSRGGGDHVVTLA